MFKPKKDIFSELLNNMAKNLQETTNHLVNASITNEADVLSLSAKIKEFEHKGDVFMREVITELNKAFITPIEREDILELASNIDDVLDEIEHCTALFDMYALSSIDGHMKQFFETIHEGSKEIASATDFIAKKNLSGIHAHSKALKDLETKGDELFHVAIKELFSNQKDLITLIKYKEVYESLEKITDYGQNVAKTLETIVMKNA